MKPIALIVFATVILASCGPRPATTNRSAPSAPTTSQRDEAKIQCVANGGFLIPSGNDFACKMDNGSVVSLSRFY